MKVITNNLRIEGLEDSWISVEERLPAVGEQILGYGIWECDEVIEPGIEIGFRSAIDNPKKPEEWCDFSFPITHWMPLPSPPISQKPGE